MAQWCISGNMEDSSATWVLGRRNEGSGFRVSGLDFRVWCLVA